VTGYDTRMWPLAIALAGLAGFVDAIGFLRLGGFFVSFMSGNSTRLAVGIADGSTAAVTAGALIGGFVIGAVIGSVLSGLAGQWRKVAVLALVTLLLAAAAMAGAAGWERWMIAALALAMGAENAVFQRDGQVSIGVTYMTGTLVKVAHGLADLLLGRARWRWVPHLLLWLGLMTGAVIGAALYRSIALDALWAAVAAAAILTLAAARLGPVAAR